MQNIFKDKWFYYKLGSFLITLSLLLYTYINHLVTQTWFNESIMYPFKYYLFQSYYLSFFTIQSNILVMVWFFLALLFHNKEDKVIWTGQKAKIIMCTYISVTCFIYFTALLPFAKMDNAYKWITGFGQHLIVPGLMIIYGILKTGKNKIDYKKYSYESLPYNLIYPILYLLVIVVRAEFLRKDSVPDVIAYPYYFLNYHQRSLGMPGVATFILFVVIITTLFIAFNYLYVYFNNLRYRQINWTEVQKNS